MHRVLTSIALALGVSGTGATEYIMSTNSQCSGSGTTVTQSGSSVGQCNYVPQFNKYLKLYCAGGSGSSVDIQICSDNACQNCVRSTCAQNQCCPLNSGYYGKVSSISCSSGSSGSNGGSTSYGATWWDGTFSYSGMSGQCPWLDTASCDYKCGQSYSGSVSGSTLTFTPRSVSGCLCDTLQFSMSDANTASASVSQGSFKVRRDGSVAQIAATNNQGTTCTATYQKSNAAGLGASAVFTVFVTLATLLLL